MITKEEWRREQKKLKEVLEKVDQTREELQEEVLGEEESFQDFQRLVWEGKSSFDRAEFNQVLASNAMEAQKILAKRMYFKRICLISKKPYFGSFRYQEEGKEYHIYLSFTYLTDENYNNILYDWRSPVCSLFYDYEIGPCQYEAPGGIYHGTLKEKRQYKIDDRKLLAVFDNSLNIDDDVLQDVLAHNNSDKMKNIVNTIQQEQNEVIRNLDDKNLIVQGIAGSGKTSVALHRIAFLLYRIETLTSNQILIFSPNQIFSEYISNVLPELGEDNTLQTTFSDYLSYFLKEFSKVESFSHFIACYYEGKRERTEFLSYQQSRKIIKDMECYLEDYIDRAMILQDFVEGREHFVSKEEINELLHGRYQRLPFFERIEEIAEKLSMRFYQNRQKKGTFRKLLYQNASFQKNYKEIYLDFYQSPYSEYILEERKGREFLKQKEISYADALLFAYMKGILEGFPYEGNIKQVVVDEAQDYNYLQYVMMQKIFAKANFTILGDINQNMNPYASYSSLAVLQDIFASSRYLELKKTYRSSPEIIEYTNQILNLSLTSAIRRETNIPVGHHESEEDLIESISKLHQKYASLAIITKEEKSAFRLYERLKDSFSLSLLTGESKKFQREFVIVPSYLAKGLEFDSVIVYNDPQNPFQDSDKFLLYIACTRAQQELQLYYL